MKFCKLSIAGLLTVGFAYMVVQGAIFAGSGNAAAMELTDMLGDRVVLDEPARSIVPFFFFEEIFALGAQDAIVGWSRGYWEGRRQWTWEKYVEESGFPAESIPDVGYAATGNADSEKIASLKPDLAVAPFRLADLEQRLGKYGIPVLHVDFYDQKNTCDSILLLGQALGLRERAMALVDFYQMQIRRVTDVTERLTPEQRPAVYVEMGLTPHNTYGADFMFGKTIAMAGGKNIADGYGIVKNGNISPEYLFKADPDVIIVTCANWANKSQHGKGAPLLGYYATPENAPYSLEDRFDRPGWEHLQAVKNKRVCYIHHGLSRHIYDFVSLQYFAKWIHPGAFQDLDPEEAWREFHERFLPVGFGGKWGMP